MGSITYFLERAKVLAKQILSEEKSQSDIKDSEINDLHAVESGKYETWRNAYIQKFDKKESWQYIENTIQFEKKQQTKNNRLLRTWRSVAAAVLLVALGTGAYFIFQDTKPQETVLGLPGESVAVLQVENQGKINLSDQDTIIHFQQVKGQINSGKLVYSNTDSNQDKFEIHTINVPSKGEYFVQLSDGTKVWLNAESSLKFKSKFVGKQRVVELQGEAYFEVAKDPEMPFVVKTAHTFVKVLGTKFNLKAYADEDYTYTTLNEGKVSLIMDDNQKVISPNEQVVFNKINKEYTTKTVDASIYSAWTEGRLLFKDERLEDILNTLSRWYGLSVFYRDASKKDERFSISVNRYDEIHPLIRHLELTRSVQIEINNSALIVE
ncbi:FecR family protein [Saccharicrinis carchari]|uniref:FecR family protein n=1 Tax=Saccharicrinis carchari TaxID=1168039 RepID=A0A521B566_SACCC|nr:FecR family protein [Saccharicrinis carchari]SMO42191.1 FecR family protein [Saccharicrinis carchari]